MWLHYQRSTIACLHRLGAWIWQRQNNVRLRAKQKEVYQMYLFFSFDSIFWSIIFFALCDLTVEHACAWISGYLLFHDTNLPDLQIQDFFMRPLLWLSLDKVKNVRLCWVRVLSALHSENGSFVLVNRFGEKVLGIGYTHLFPNGLTQPTSPGTSERNLLTLHTVVFLSSLHPRKYRLRFLGPFGQRHPFFHGFPLNNGPWQLRPRWFYRICERWVDWVQPLRMWRKICDGLVGQPCQGTK